MALNTTMFSLCKRFEKVLDNHMHFDLENDPKFFDQNLHMILYGLHACDIFKLILLYTTFGWKTKGTNITIYS